MGSNCFSVFSEQFSVPVRLPEKGICSQLCPGCDGSALMFPAHFLSLHMYKYWMGGRLAPTVFSAVLIVCCKLFLSCLVAETNQTVKDVHILDYCSRVLNQQLLRQVELLHSLNHSFTVNESTLFLLEGGILIPYSICKNVCHFESMMYLFSLTLIWIKHDKKLLSFVNIW